MADSPFINIQWQKGVSSEFGVNGCRPEQVIDEVVNRLLVFQAGPLACEENELAIKHLRLASEALVDRTKRRAEQGVFHTGVRHIFHRTEDHEEDFSATGS